MSFKFTPLSIPDVILIEPQRFEDERGFFSEIYKESEFRQAGIDNKFKQANHSRSKKGVLRGLHYQLAPKAQAKLVRVLSGKIYDVAVDIRKSSPTFGKWVAETLDSDSGKMLFIPSGFAHGFCTLSDIAEIEYFCDNEYSKPHDRGIRYDDPALNIQWPLRDPELSAKDAALPVLAKAELNFEKGVGVRS